MQADDVGLMTIKTVARRNWPNVGAGEPADNEAYATWYEPFDAYEQVRAAVSWALARPEITGIPTPGDVRLLGLVLRAEGDRMDVAEAEAALAHDDAYSSPFERMPA